MDSFFPGSYTLLFSIALAILALCKLIVYPAFNSLLSRIPNAHWSSPFANFWILYVRYKRRENRTLFAAHEKLGPIIRLGVNEISVNSIDGGVRSIYGGGFEKGEWYSIFDNYGVPCMFSSWHSRSHSARKRMISHIYSKSVLQNSPTLSSQSKEILFNRLLPIIDSAATSSEPMDVHSLWFAVAMDFITAYQFGMAHSSNFIQDVKYRTHWLGLYHSRKTYTFFAQELPRLKKFMQNFGVHLVPKWVDNANHELEQWCATRCESVTATDVLNIDYTNNLTNEPAVLKSFLNGMQKEKLSKGADSVLADTVEREPKLSIASEMLDHLAAGQETSGITMTYITWHLSQNPTLQAELRAELKTLDHPLLYGRTPILEELKENSIKSVDGVIMPSNKQLDSLPLLHAVIMETLRLEAAIPGSQPRMTPYPSCNLAGYQIPGGVRVSSAAWNLHRNASAFPNPSTWDHTRWLGESQKEQERMFWAFSSGGRMCIGSNFAMHEIKLVIAALYTNYQSYVVDDEGIEQEDGYTCGPKSNRLILRFEKVHGT